MEAVTFETASSYARHLATYIASPLKIERLVLLEFDKAPKLQAIAEMRYQVEQRNKRFGQVPCATKKDASDLGDHYRMPGMVNFARPIMLPEPVIRRANIPANTKPPAIANRIESRSETLSKGEAASLVESVAADFRLTPEDITGSKRHGYIVDARAVIVNVLMECGHSSAQVGRRMGGRDHTTILNLRNKIDIYLRRNPVARASYDRHMAAISEVVA